MSENPAEDLIDNFETTLANIAGPEDTSYDQAYKPIECPIWGHGYQARLANADGKRVVYSKRIGGVFYRERGEWGSELSDLQRLYISWAIARSNREGLVPELADLVRASAGARRPNYIDQVDFLLRYVEGAVEAPTYPVSVGEIVHGLHRGQGEVDEFRGAPRARSASFCLDDFELDALVNAAVRDGLVSREIGAYYPDVLIGLTRAGHERLSGLDDQSIYEQAFIAMWFTAEMDGVYDAAIAPAIADAGYRPFRVDRDSASGDQISNEILAQIRRSRFVVADVTHGETGVRGGVYFEAGFAQGLGLPTFFMVRRDGIGSVHFDTRQYPHTLWAADDLEQLRRDLANTIIARLGVGPLHR